MRKLGKCSVFHFVREGKSFHISFSLHVALASAQVGKCFSLMMLEAFNSFFIFPQGDVSFVQTPPIHRMKKTYKIIWKMENSLSDAIPLAFLGDFLFKLFFLLLPLEQGTVQNKKLKNIFPYLQTFFFYVAFS